MIVLPVVPVKVIFITVLIKIFYYLYKYLFIHIVTCIHIMNSPAPHISEVFIFFHIIYRYNMKNTFDLLSIIYRYVIVQI